MRKPGRPKLSAAERRRVTLTLRVTLADYKEIHALAKEAGMTPSEWVRDAIMLAMSSTLEARFFEQEQNRQRKSKKRSTHA